jgi:hypothetical protein
MSVITSRRSCCILLSSPKPASQPEAAWTWRVAGQVALTPVLLDADHLHDHDHDIPCALVVRRSE